MVVLTNKARDQVIVFRKKESSLSRPDSPERSKTLLYAGGHIRAEDSATVPESDLLTVSINALQREVKEEVGLSVAPQQGNVLCIWDRRSGNARSKIHMAICFVAEFDLKTLRPRLDNYEFVPRGAKTKSGRVQDTSNLGVEESLEEWSRVILSNVLVSKRLELPFSGDESHNPPS